MTRREDIVRHARELIGVPFRHQGYNEFGTDCAGLVRWTYAKLGLGEPEVPAYERSPDGETLLATVRRYGQEIEIGEASIGDVLIFRFAKLPQHLGIVTEHGMIHSYWTIGRVVEHGLDQKWRNRICAAFRFPGVEA
jgi:NlpC/P60 family putative phage cell wall peptidase